MNEFIDSLIARSTAQFLDRNDNGRLEFSEYSTRALAFLDQRLELEGRSISSATVREAHALTPDLIRAGYTQIYEASPQSFPNGMEQPTDRQVSALIESVRARVDRGGNLDADGRLGRLIESTAVQRDMVSSVVDVVADDIHAGVTRLVSTVRRER